MNYQLAQAQAQVKRLSSEALTVLDDPRVDTARKKAHLNKIEPELRRWADEVDSLKSVESARSSFAGFGAMADTNGSDGGFYPPGDPAAARGFDGAALSASGFTTKAAPPVRLDGDTAREMFEAARSRKSFAVDLGLKTTTSAGVPISLVPEVDRNLALVRREPNRILDLIPTRATTSPVVEYFVQTTAATAGVVAEGALKPGNDLALPMQTARAAKIAGWVDVTDETLADFDQFLSVVTNDLTAAVIDAENAELLNGLGTAPNYITGLLNTTGILVRAFNAASDTYALDTLDLAETDVRTGPAFAELTAWVMNPTTFSRTRRAKDGQGRFIVNPDPTGATAHTLWGKPVVLSTKAPTGVALGADFADAARGFVRESIRVTMSNSTVSSDGTSNFKRNVTTVLAEERVGAYVVRPAAVVKVTGLPT